MSVNVSFELDNIWLFFFFHCYFPLTAPWRAFPYWPKLGTCLSCNLHSRKFAFSPRAGRRMSFPASRLSKVKLSFSFSNSALHCLVSYFRNESVAYRYVTVLFECYISRPQTFMCFAELLPRDDSAWTLKNSLPDNDLSKNRTANAGELKHTHFPNLLKKCIGR